MKDPYGNFGQVYSGPGFRLPFYIISPWTRGSNVYVEHADHSSQIKFVGKYLHGVARPHIVCNSRLKPNAEQWLKTKGKNVVTDQIPAWRRANMADLTKAFDFSKVRFATSLDSNPR